MKNLRWWLGIPGLLVLTFFLYGELASSYFLRVAFQPRDKLSYESKLPDLNAASVQEVMLRYGMERHRTLSLDEEILCALHIPNDTARGTVLLLHGYKDNPFGMLEYADMYLEMGYRVVMPDMRAHGCSEGKYVGFGWLDRRDVLRWVNWIDNMFPGSVVVLHGVSMGASSALMALGENIPASVVACIADCGFTSVYDVFDFQIRNVKPHSRAIFKSYVLKRASQKTEKKIGFLLEEASAVKQILNSELPLLIIHGDADDFVPYSMATELYEAKKNGYRQLWTVPGAGHGASISLYPEEYKKTCREFLDRFVP